MSTIKKKNISLVNAQKIQDINNRINKEICHDTIQKLKDTSLINEYKECKSVQNEITKLELILKKYNVKSNKIELIINDYILDLIPAGTKGVIRGNVFNNVVKNTIKSFKLDDKRFDVQFEKDCKICMTSERPDWYVHEINTGKIIIGMNQLALWGGGQQINRGYKYIIDNKHNTEKSKLLCVVCNHKKFDTYNKETTLFEVGFTNNTLTYLKNLESIINNYFT